MSGTTFSKFFWQDWLGDDELGLCSMAARGVWMGLLVIAARSKVRGHVLLGGRKPSLADLRHALRCPEGTTDEALDGWVKELVAKGACDLSREGIIISRRMVRDSQRQRRNSEAGKKSAEVRHGRYGTSAVGSNGVQEAPSTTSHKPLATSHQPDAADNTKWISEISAAIGFDITQNRKLASNAHAAMATMVRLDIDLRLDLLPAIAEIRDSGRDLTAINSLSYFREKALERMRFRKQMAQASSAPPPERNLDQWREIMERFLDRGLWVATPLCGPRPTQEGCLCPPALLERARVIWNANGQRPPNGRDDPFTRGYFELGPMPFWGDNVVSLDTKRSA